MLSKIEALLARIEGFNSTNPAEIEDFRVKILGRKGELNDILEEFKKVAPEQKRELGQKINLVKTAATSRINTLKEMAADAAQAPAAAIGDMTRPGSEDGIGSRHPISLVRREIVDIFSRLGYTVAEGPEMEDDWHVFSALNFPPEHPARDMQDTFFIEKNPDILLNLGKAKQEGQILVGFAAETNDLIKHAKQKIEKKNLDMIVANDVTVKGAGFNVDTNIVKLIHADGRIEECQQMTKREVAEIILNKVVEMC